MKRGYAGSKAGAKSTADKVAGKCRSDCRWFLPILAEIRQIFPRKTAAELALLANRSERVCEKWLARQGTPDGEALAALLNSRIGDRLILAMTASSAAPWRKRLARQIQIAELQEKKRLIDLEIAATERGDR